MKKEGEIMPVKTVTSPSWRFARLHAVRQTKMGDVKQDTKHVSKWIFWYK